MLISGLSVPAASGFTRLVISPRVPMGHFFPRISLRIHHDEKRTPLYPMPIGEMSPAGSGVMEGAYLLCSTCGNFLYVKYGMQKRKNPAEARFKIL